MRLTSINLQNFRSHASTRLELGRLNVFAGEKGSGKSSVLLGLAALLCGRNVLTDARGVGLDEQANTNGTGNGFKLSAEIEHSGRSRVITRNKGTDGHSFIAVGEAPLTLLDQKAACLAWLGVREACVLALLDLRPLLARSIAEQKAELLAAIQPVNGSLPVPETAKALVQKHLEIGAIESIEHAENLYQMAYDMRRDVTRKKRNIVVPQVPKVQEGKFPKPDSVAHDLDEFRKHMVGLLEEKSSLSAAISMFENLQLEGAPDPTWEEKEHPAQLMARVEKEHLGRRDELQRLTAEAERVGSQLETLARDGKSCFTCGRTLTATARNKLLAELGAKGEALKTDLASVQKSLEHTKNYVREISDKIAQFREAKERAQARRQQAEKILETQPQVEQAKQKLPQVLQAISDLNQRIERGQQVWREVTELERQHVEFRRAKEKANGLFAEIDELETLVEFLGPQGIRAQLLGEWVPPFLERMSGILFGFSMGDATLDLGLDRAFRFLVGGLPAPLLSEGEQLAFEYAYRAALAELSGLSIVVIDSASHMDHTAQQALLQRAGERNEQVVMVSTVSELPDWRGQADARVFWFEKDQEGTTQIREV